MLIDAQNTFSNSQAITASAASTDVLDLGAVRNIGVGEHLYIVFHVTVAFTDTGSDSTVTPSLETDDNSSFSSAATVDTFATLAALTPANTYRFYPLAPITAAGLYERYLRVYYTVAGGNLTTGSISAFLTHDIQAFRAYTSGYTVQ
jgi:hypothetical protein